MAKKATRDRGTALHIELVPPEVLAEFKAKAESRGRSMKWLIVQFMKLYIERGDDALPEADQ